MREFTLILLLSFGYCSAWICGNTGQCSCTSSGTVLCKDVSEAPFFMTDNRAGLKLTITTREADFDLTSLSDTVGFEKVMIDGLSTDLCSQTLVLFPWVRCLVSTRDTPMQTLRSEVTDAVTAASEEPLIASRTSLQSYGTSMIVWTAIISIVGGILTCCILVSLVNLHARINSHARASDPPLFAIACCLKCMALLLLPIHLIAK